MEKQVADSQGQTKRKPKSLFRRIVVAMVWLIVVVAALLALAPSLLSSGPGTKIVQSKLGKALGGTVEMGHLSLGWFSGLKIDNLTFTDLKNGTSVEIREVRSKPLLLALLHGRIALKATVIDKPQVQLTVQAPRPSDGSAKSESPKARASAFAMDTLDLAVQDGQLILDMQSPDRPSQRVQFQGFASKVDLRPAGQASQFSMLTQVVQPGQPASINTQGAFKLGDSGWTLKGTSGQLKVEIDKVQLASFRPLLAMLGTDLTADGKLQADMDIQITDGMPEKVNAKAELTELSQMVDGKKTTIQQPVKLDAQLTTTNQKLLIDNVQVSSSFCQVQCKGTTEAIDYTVAADLAQTQSFAKQFADLGPWQFAGKLAAQGNVQLAKDATVVKAQTKVDQLVVRKDQTVTPATNATADLGFRLPADRKTLAIEAFKLVSDPATVEIAKSTIPLAKDVQQPIAVTATTSADLAKLRPFVALVAKMPDNLQWGGKLDGQVAISKDKDVFHVQTDKTTIRNLMIVEKDEKDKKPFVQDVVKLVADVFLDTKEKTIAAKQFNLEGTSGQAIIRVTQAQIQQKADKTDTQMNGKIDAEIDLGAVRAIAAPVFPKGLDITGRQKAQLVFDSKYPTDKPSQLAANLNLAPTTIGFDKASYKGYTIGQTKVALQAKQGLLAIAPFQTTVNEGTLDFAGQIDMRTSPMVLSAASAMPKVANLQLNRECGWVLQMVPFFGNLFTDDSAQVKGKLNLGCDQMVVPLSGQNTQNIAVLGTLSIDELTLSSGGLLTELLTGMGQSREQPMRVNPTKFRVRNAVISYDDMQLDVGNNPVNFAGTIGFDERLDMKVTLPWTIGGRTARVGKESTAPRITIPITGTIRKYEIKIEKIIENVIPGLIEGLLKK
jgi:hypothetical protein